MNRNDSRERFTKLSALCAFATVAAVPHGALAMTTPAASAEGVRGKIYVSVATATTNSVEASIVELSSGNTPLDESAL